MIGELKTRPATWTSKTTGSSLLTWQLLIASPIAPLGILKIGDQFNPIMRRELPAASGLIANAVSAHDRQTLVVIERFSVVLETFGRA